MNRFCSTAFFLCSSLYAMQTSIPALSCRSFLTQSSIFISSPYGLVAYTFDSKNVRPIMLDAEIGEENILDITESENVLWIASTKGIFRYDMASNTSERLPTFERDIDYAKIAADYDYVWVAIYDTIWQFDILGREWTAHAIPQVLSSSAFKLFGIFSTSNQLYCIYHKGAFIFSVADEKWTPSLLAVDSISEQAYCFSAKSDIFVVDQNRIYRFIPNSQSWDIIKADAAIIDISLGQNLRSNNTLIYFLTAQSAFSYNVSTSSLVKLNIRDGTGFSSIVHYSDSVAAISSAEHILLYNIISQETSYIPYPLVSTPHISKLFKSGNFMLAFSPNRILTYDIKSSLWELSPITNMTVSRKIAVWDDKGFTIEWARQYSSVLRGGIEQYVVFTDTMAFDTLASRLVPLEQPETSTVVDSLGRSYQVIRRFRTIDSVDTIRLAYSLPISRAALHLHNTLPQDRFLDIMFNNRDDQWSVARKELFYRGSQSDILQSVKAGTVPFDLPSSSTIPYVKTEGVAITLESPQKLQNRDRKIGRLHMGAGFMTTQSRYEMLRYSPSGVYKLSYASSVTDTLSDTIQIEPGSVRLWIDGELLDTTSYSVNFRSGSLLLNRNVVVDPTSAISVSYRLITIPDNGPQSIEFIPTNNFGNIGYGFLTVSPFEWFSVKSGYLAKNPLRRENRNFFNLMLPIQLRKQNLLLKIDPEFCSNTDGTTKSSGIGIISRFGEQFSVIINSKYSDTAFTTTDLIKREIGIIKTDMDAKATYYATPNMPIFFSAKNANATRGSKNFYELGMGIHFPKYPFADFSLSRNVIELADTSLDKNFATVPTDTTMMADSAYFDTLTNVINLRKNKFKIKFYESSSFFLERYAKLKSYEITFSQYQSADIKNQQFGVGRFIYAQTNFLPLNGLTCAIYGRYQKNPYFSIISNRIEPGIQLQTVDFPKGLDMSATYALAAEKTALTDSTTASVLHSVSIIAKPGSWYNRLYWLSPRCAITQLIQSKFLGRWVPASFLSYGNDGIVSSLNRMVGFYLFPNTDISIINTNSWITKSDSGSAFIGFNDIKIWFNNKNAMWQTRWQHFNNSQSLIRNSAFTQYENQWTPKIKTRSGLSGSYDKIKPDSLHISFGPRGDFTYHVHNLSIIKKLSTTHTTDIRWLWVNKQRVSDKPTILYNMNLVITLVPNIIITAQNMFEFTTENKNYTLNDYRGELRGQLIF